VTESLEVSEVQISEVFESFFENVYEEYEEKVYLQKIPLRPE
jgi:hypothetical protein